MGGFSLAALLRRSGFEGELRAVGPVLPDQVDDLLRMGFDAVDIERPEGPPATVIRAARPISTSLIPAL
ncbi:MAG: DUF934 domain-containing protein [Oceanicaulis sp.]|nr:DUF934 domain-containing protein [Oceanicaulis sp.]